MTKALFRAFIIFDKRIIGKAPSNPIAIGSPPVGETWLWLLIFLKLNLN
jgi:hypothetical protein